MLYVVGILCWQISDGCSELKIHFRKEENNRRMWEENSLSDCSFFSLFVN